MLLGSSRYFLFSQILIRQKENSRYLVAIETVPGGENNPVPSSLLPSGVESVDTKNRRSEYVFLSLWIQWVVRLVIF